MATEQVSGCLPKGVEGGMAKRHKEPLEDMEMFVLVVLLVSWLYRCVRLMDCTWFFYFNIFIGV